MDQTTTPVLLLTGYLGSGKTTLLNRILANRKGIRFAVIVNDIGEVNIDASLIRKGGIVGQDESDDLVALQNGCICCTLKTDLIRQIDSLISSGNFDYIVIEASGVCEPAPIAGTICAMRQMTVPEDGMTRRPRLDCIVTVVDALRLKSDFGCGSSLTRSGLDEDDIENLIIEQIEFCDIILLNKISEVSGDEASRIKAVIRALQPTAKIICCDYCDVELDRIIDTGMFDFEKVATSATWVRELERIVPDDDINDHEHHDHLGHNHEHEHKHEHHHHHDGDGEADEYGIGTWVYFRRAPFNFDRFDRFVNLDWPRNVIRAKGVVYFSHNRDMSLLFEQAGVQKKLTEAGYWYATAPEAELQRMLASDPGLRHDWDPAYGDRMIKLVFIGRDLDREDLATRLDACLEKE